MNAPRAAAPMPSAGQLALILGGGSALTQVARQLGTVLDRAFADLDLTAQQAALLMHANDADASPTRLMARLGTDTAGMTKLIDRLASKGLLARRRNAADRRSVVLDVTDAGKELALRVPAIFGKVTHQLLSGFTTDEVSALSAMLQRMAANLSASPDAPATLPERERDRFLRAHRHAVDGARDPVGWRQLRRVLRLRSWMAIAASRPGHYEARQHAAGGLHPPRDVARDLSAVAGAVRARPDDRPS